tara:strand:+ start:3730 stop:4266 length:537 start_codon:yes stop_codon:yes gene_type:complete
MKRIFILLFIIIAGCGTDELSREKATKLLPSHFKTETITELYRVNHNERNKMKSHNYLDFDIRQKHSQFATTTYYENYKLKNKAKEYVQKTEYSFKNPVYTFIVGKNKFVEISGIINSEKSAVAECQMIFEPNEIGQNLFDKKQMSYINKIEFKKYDDGWRFEKIVEDNGLKSIDYLK